MTVGIIGCGLIGHKRAKALGDSRLVIVADTHRASADRLAAAHPGCVATTDPLAVIARDDVQLVIIATTNDALAPLALAAVQRGKHVLVEKPGARMADELMPVVEAARRAGVVVKVGFNHRFHPAFMKAREIWDSGVCGPLMFIRARYGQGGRLGMEKEWRGQARIAGGGEMLDQGVHLIDLARWFAGDFVEVDGHVGRFFWQWEVEDNGFALLKTAGGQVAWLHASCTEWKNLFSFEIYGRDAKLHIDGLGGSYGVERLTHYQMLPAMGPPDTTSWEYPGEDRSWHREYAHLVACIEEGVPVLGGLDDALAALRVVDRLYEKAQAPHLALRGTANTQA
jgi:predicted dehydrogenase